MTMVRFATTCDTCQRRSTEYTAWPTCRECGNHVCPAHYESWTVTSADVDTPETRLCKTCLHAT